MKKLLLLFFDIFNEKNISIDFLNRKFLQKNSIEWQKILNEKDICCEVIKHFEDVHHDIQAWENGYFEKVKLKNGKEIAMVKSPVYFSNYQTRPISISKPIGSDTKEILQTLGYLEGEIETLVNRKAVKI